MARRGHTVDAADHHWLLAAALLSSLVDDLHRLRKKGMWKLHPDEMRSHHWFRTQADLAMPPKESGKPSKLHTFLETPEEVLEEFHSSEVSWLVELIAAETQNKILISRNDLVRWARASLK